MPESSPMLSVVTPTYNQAATLRETMESILAEGLGADVQYIVVDACSTDGTEEIVRSLEPAFVEQGARWLYVREKDDGQADAINKGWRLARGEIMAYINSDDYYLPGALRTVLEYFRRHGDTQWAYGGWHLVGGDGRTHRVVQPHRYSRSKLLNHSIIGQPSCFFRRRLLDEKGYLNPDLHLAMDYDLWLRFAEDHAAGIIPVALSAMRYHPDAKSAAFTRKQLREILRLATRDTHPLSVRRLIQYFYYLRGLCVTLCGMDIARRIARADSRASASATRGNR